MKTRHLLLSLLACVAVFGCDQRSTNGPATATTAAAPAPPPALASAAPPSAGSALTPTVAAKMAEHFSSSVALRESLIKGDLEAFRAAAATLSDKELSANLSDAWKPNLEGMRLAAKRARDAHSVDAAARALAEVGRACATCHEKLGGPKLVVGTPPAPGSGAKPHMDRHHWAAARLWEGLMGPSEEAWRKGAEIFTDAPLQPQAIAGAKSVAPEINELAQRAHALGQQAHVAKDAAARTKSVGDVYATCMSCHTKLGVTIK